MKYSRKIFSKRLILRRDDYQKQIKSIFKRISNYIILYIYINIYIYIYIYIYIIYIYDICEQYADDVASHI